MYGSLLPSSTDDRLAVGTIRGYLVERARTDPPFYATVAFNWKRISFEKGFLHDCETLEAAIARMDEIDERALFEGVCAVFQRALIHPTALQTVAVSPQMIEHHHIWALAD